VALGAGGWCQEDSEKYVSDTACILLMVLDTLMRNMHYFFTFFCVPMLGQVQGSVVTRKSEKVKLASHYVIPISFFSSVVFYLHFF